MRVYIKPQALPSGATVTVDWYSNETWMSLATFSTADNCSVPARGWSAAVTGGTNDQSLSVTVHEAACSPFSAVFGGKRSNDRAVP